jgi:hypothetical protein
LHEHTPPLIGLTIYWFILLAAPVQVKKKAKRRFHYPTVFQADPGETAIFSADQKWR